LAGYFPFSVRKGTTLRERWGRGGGGAVGLIYIQIKTFAKRGTWGDIKGRNLERQAKKGEALLQIPSFSPGHTRKNGERMAVWINFKIVNRMTHRVNKFINKLSAHMEANFKFYLFWLHVVLIIPKGQCCIKQQESRRIVGVTTPRG